MQQNLRYSITLNEAQLDYLSDEQQEIHRMKCFKTFLQMAIPEENRVYGKNFSAVLQPGQFVASKVDLARLWGCDRKTATRIVQEFNQLGILRSEPSNRTTIHTMICLSAWFEYRGMIRSRFFVSNPEVKPIVKSVRTARCVPSETAVETNKSDCANPPDPGGTS
jgi:DNA-binding transcriptional MocR family regulator